MILSLMVYLASAIILKLILLYKSKKKADKFKKVEGEYNSNPIPGLTFTQAMDCVILLPFVNTVFLLFSIHRIIKKAIEGETTNPI